MRGTSTVIIMLAWTWLSGPERLHGLSDCSAMRNYEQSSTQMGPDWTWIENDKTQRNLEELHEILKRPPASLRYAYFNHGNLGGLDFSQADLWAAYFQDANLTEARFDDANLESARASGANFRLASFYRARLSGADFAFTDLSKARFEGTDLRVKTFQCADLSGAYYEPAQNPDPQTLAMAEGLDTLVFGLNSAPIVALKKSLSDAGFSRQANQVQASYRRHGELPIERLLFDWTCEWGADWSHPLWLLCRLCLLFTPVYWLGLHLRQRDGLYVVSTGQRVVTSRGKERWRRLYVVRMRSLTKKERRVIGPLPAPRWKTWRMSFELWITRWVLAEGKAMKTAFLFSVMSALNLGFHDFNFGRWIKMLQPREFDLRARGWMRVASGVQSLLGLYLVALSLLCYFGHPFE